MRYQVTARDGRTGASVDVLLEVEATDTVADLAPMLRACLPAGAAQPSDPRQAGGWGVWVDGHAVAPTDSLPAARVLPGSVVSLAAPGATRSLPTGAAEIRVVNGPGAGRVHRLSLGDTPVGNGAAGFSLPDLLLPRDALAVRVEPGATHGIRITVRCAPGLAARLDTTELRPGVATVWPEGAILVVGGTVLTLASIRPPESDVSPAGDRMGLDVNRPPRLLPEARSRAFTRPRPPSEVVKRPLPWLLVLAPALVAFPLYFIFGPRALVFALMSPLLAIANWMSDRQGARKRYLAEARRFASQSEDLDRRVAAAVVTEQRERRDGCPDPAAVLLTALGPGRRLWERRRSDPDRLHLRLGLVDTEADLTVTDPARAEHEDPPPPQTVRDVPAVLDVAAAGVVGIHGEHAVRLTQCLLGQAAVLHSPRDLRIVCLTERDSEDRFGWLRWLPHSATDDVEVGASVGIDQESVAARLAELTALVSARPAARVAGPRVALPPAPDVLLVLDGARRLRSLPAVVHLLRDGPAAGVMTLCLDDEEALLPEECRAVVRAADEVSVRLTLAKEVTGIRPDLVDPAWVDRVARALAPLRDTTPEEADAAGLPAIARLLDIVGLDPPTPQAVAAGWRRGGRTTEATVGIGFDGPFRLDLRRDGPHALVGGMTGSGKSELLQTLVASLAIVNRPDALTFVLVDYKGGAAFKDCALLPHTVGMVTDLDDHLVQRALTSLGAELRRREHLLAVPGAKDLEDYWVLQRSDPALPAIARLVLVIDEFASLKAELPDFVAGLVSIAQRGRSLGIHLVLATQRPSGAVGPDIRANTNLRICLRVADEADSHDVVDSPEAARIRLDQPGRAYVRTGATTLLPFQSARVGGRPPAADAAAPRPAPVAWPLPWSLLGAAAPRRAAATGTAGDEGVTDLAQLVAAVRAAADGLPVQPSPWLPALPGVVTVADARQPEDDAAAGGVAWALEDRPGQQAQRPRLLHPGREHLYVVGGARSGRSTALRTIAVQLARRFGTADLHLHALDCGGGAMLPLAELPNTGAVVSRTETERADRLLRRLADEVAERQQRLSDGGLADIDEQRAASPPEHRMPYLVVLVDRWEGFLSGLGELDAGRLVDTVQLLLREGGSVGVQVVVSGDRSLLGGRMSTLVEDKLIMRLPEHSDVTLAGLSARQVPRNMPPGRGVWAGSGIESQVLVLAADTTGAAQADVVREVGARCRARDADVPAYQRPFVLRGLPGQVSAADVLRLPMPPPMSWLPFGVGGDDAAPVGLDLAATPVALVAGPPRSGRTTCLRWLLRAARQRGAPQVVCFGPRSHRELAAQAGDGLLDLGAGPDAAVARIRALPPGAVVLVDDAESFREGEFAPLLQVLVRQARDNGWAVVLAGSAVELAGGFGGWPSEARRARQGLLLSPQQPGDGEVLSLRLARSALAPRVHPGRGLLVRGGGEATPVQVPHATAAGD